MRAVLGGRAEADLTEAAAYYETRRPGLGSRFADAFERALVMISRSPFAWPVFDQPVRACPIRAYPYPILYQPQDDVARVVAIAHTHRKPGFWRDRLRDPGTPAE